MVKKNNVYIIIVIIILVLIIIGIVLYHILQKPDNYDNVISKVKVPKNETWEDIHDGQCSIPGNTFIFKEKKKPEGKLAFLFMIKDNLDWIDLWNKYFDNVDPNKYKIIIHISDSSSSKKINLNVSHIVINTVESAWCELVGVKKALIKEALLDNNISGCIFISNNCVPIKKFDYVRNLYLSQNNSILRFSSPKFTKASLWCYLNRKFMNSYLKCNTNNLPSGGCQEEMFLGKIIDTFNLDVIHGTVTFDCWNKSHFNFLKEQDLDKIAPLQFKKLDARILNFLNKSQVCFLRKVNFNKFNFDLVYNNIF